MLRSMHRFCDIATFSNDVTINGALVVGATSARNVKGNKKNCFDFLAPFTKTQNFTTNINEMNVYKSRCGSPKLKRKGGKHVV